MILVADNLTITDRRVENALAKMEPEFTQELVKKCEIARACSTLADDRIFSWKGFLY